MNRGDEIGAVNEKLYVKYVKLILKEQVKRGDKIEVLEKDSERIEQGRRIMLFDVEGDRSVVGISVPVSGHKYTIYTHNKENNQFEAYPLDDLTGFVTSTRTEEEEEEEKEVAKRWWGEVVGEPVVKKEEPKKKGKKRARQPIVAHNKRRAQQFREGDSSSTEVVELKAMNAALQETVKNQNELFAKTSNDMMERVMTFSLEMVKAFRSNN